MEDFVHEILALEDETAVKRLQTMFDTKKVDDSLWQYLDKTGNTLLHLVAVQSMPRCLDWILERQNDLATKRNGRGETPFEALQSHLESTRTSHTVCTPMESFEDFFGSSDASVCCLLQLAKVFIPSLHERSRFKYGCSCGECRSGFLSPRMSLALEWHASRWACFLRDDISDGERWARLNVANLIYTPHELQRELAKRRAMREGFAAVAGFIAACLRWHIIPTENNIRKVIYTSQEWPPICQDYLLRGGTVSAVACIIFREATENDSLAGHSLFQDENEEAIAQLPVCRNDHEFGFALSMCGYTEAKAFHPNEGVN
jgi:hypothetical protein